MEQRVNMMDCLTLGKWLMIAGIIRCKYEILLPLLNAWRTYFVRQMFNRHVHVAC